MSKELTSILLYCIAFTGAGIILYRNVFHSRDVQRVHRAAWSGAWLAMTLDLVRDFASGKVHSLETLHFGGTVYLWAAFMILWMHRGFRVPGLPQICGPVLGIAIPAVLCDHWSFMLLVSGSAFAIFMQVITTLNVLLRIRTIVYCLSFFGTFAVILPVAATAADPHMGAALMTLHIPLYSSAIMLLCGMYLLGTSTLQFVRAGGTPEPLDAPPKLCQSGIYGLMRHPIQLGHVMMVSACCLMIDTPTSMTYAICFSIAMLFPLRWIEEKKLMARYGESYRAYKLKVPCYGVTSL